ncbi:Protein STA-2 [Aphelenchoides avenae]|nr:Protein STA-2 [Aphelenchus avenae]
MAAQMDSTFVSKHNASAEIYQSFKDDVDVLFSGSIAFDDRERLLMRINRSLENLIVAFEAEKEYLMDDVLCDWAVRQQKFTVAALWTQQMNYNQLGPIDTQFEYFGELLEHTLGGLNYLMAQYPKQGFEEFYSRIRHITHYFLFYSIIVSKQPPSIVST